MPAGIDNNKVNALHVGHKVARDVHGSAAVLTNSFGGVDQGVDNNIVHKVDIRFLLTDLAVNASGWKIRVVATYSDKTIEFTDTSAYSVGYLGSIVSGTGIITRGQIDFGDVIAGNSQTRSNLNTGEYRANNTSNITLSAGTLFTGDTALAFAATDGSPGVGEVSLACGPIGGTPQYLTAANEAKTLLSSVPSLAEENKTLTTNITAAQHECTLHVGTVDTGTYSSQMTVGIGKVTP